MGMCPPDLSFGNSLDSSGNPGSSPSTQEPGLFWGKRGPSASPEFPGRDLGWLREWRRETETALKATIKGGDGRRRPARRGNGPGPCGYQVSPRRRRGVKIKGSGPAVLPPDICHARAFPAPALSLPPWVGGWVTPISKIANLRPAGLRPGIWRPGGCWPGRVPPSRRACGPSCPQTPAREWPSLGKSTWEQPPPPPPPPLAGRIPAFPVSLPLATVPAPLLSRPRLAAPRRVMLLAVKKRP